MQTNIKQVTPVEYDLEIRATADELAPDLNKVLREQRSRTNLKGFRKGRVPLSVVRKLYGKALAYGVAEKNIQASYESSVLESGEHEVLGRPRITTLDYEMDGDLFAVIRFGVRPDVDLAPTEGETISRLKHEATDEDVVKEIKRLRESRAEHPVKEGAVDPDDEVVVDLQLLDEQGLPVVGRKEEEVTFHLGDERVKDAFRQALLERSAGDEVVVTMQQVHDHDHDGESDPERGDSHDHDHDHDHEHDHAHDHDDDERRYQVKLREVREHKLPDFDDAFAKEVSDGKFETADAFRDEIRNQLIDAWESRSRELFESTIVERMLELNPLDVPEAVVDLYLDSFVEDFKRQSGDELPEGFNEDAFRAQYREEAEKQGRWMLIRDHVIESASIEVTDADRNAFFGKMAGGDDVDPKFLAQYYASVPGLADRMNQRLLSEKVFANLADRFEVVEKSRDEIEAERKEKVEAERRAREADLAGDDEKTSWWRRPIERVRNQLKKPR